MTDDDLDRQLREWGRAARAAVPESPSLPRAVPAAPRWRAPAAAAAAVVLLVGAVALATSRSGAQSVRPADEAPPAGATVPWADLPGAFETSWRGGPDPRTSLRVAVDAPASWVAGTVVPYTVVLDNPTDQPIALDPCPAFVHAIGTFRAHRQLNCAEAAAVPARGATRFAMELRVPGSAAPGPVELTWTLATPVDGAPVVQGRQRVTVDNSRYDGPSAEEGCTPEAPGPPCGPGMEPGHEYPYLAGVHCQLRELRADGRLWVPGGGPVGDGNGNPPAGWGNPGDLGVLTLTGPDTIVYESSTGQRVPLRPRTADDPDPGACA